MRLSRSSAEGRRRGKAVQVEGPGGMLLKASLLASVGVLGRATAGEKTGGLGRPCHTEALGST